MNTNLSTIELELGILRRDHGNSVGLEEIERAARAMAGVPMTTLEELKARLEKAEGPDRELDSLLFQWDETNKFTEWDGAPHYTSSLDTAIALVEAKLPGWAWMVTHGRLSLTEPFGAAGLLPPDGDMLHTGEEWINAEHKSEPIALLLALLSALIEKDKSNV